MFTLIYIYAYIHTFCSLLLKVSWDLAYLLLTEFGCLVDTTRTNRDVYTDLCAGRKR